MQNSSNENIYKFVTVNTRNSQAESCQISNVEKTTSSHGTVWKGLILFLLALLVVLLVLILVLQCIAVYDLRINPSVCSMPSSTSGSLTGGTDTCDCNNVSSIELLSQLVNTTEELSDLCIRGTDEVNFDKIQEFGIRLADIVGMLSIVENNSITTNEIVDNNYIASSGRNKGTNSKVISPSKILSRCKKQSTKQYQWLL